jgi:hypothetical protein
MRTIQLAVMSVLASAALAAPVRADDTINVTPPLYREKVRTSPVRPAAELATTPQPVAAAPVAPRFVAEAAASPLR